ncbi:transcription factor Tfb2 [Mycena filopes]|nr:transcription factor Tfb2 [Mycena filopes]
MKLVYSNGAAKQPPLPAAFLQSQSQKTLNRLYERPSSCLSIFRLLAPLQQQIIMNLLWLESAIASSTMAAWVFRDGERGTTGSFGLPPPKDDKHPPMAIDGLDGYALERWEEHVWDLLLQVSQLAEERGMDLVEVLSFLFMLLTMELDMASPTHKAMLNDLRDYGLLWQQSYTAAQRRGRSSRRFYPTRLATTLTSSSPPLPTLIGPSSEPKEGFIVIETIYRDEDNPLQTAVLDLFVALKYRFPNLGVGSITRDSAKR